MKKIIALLAMMYMGIAALSAQEQFTGKWTTIDDKTKQPAGIVEIYQDADGLYYGKLIGVYGEDKSGIGTMIVRGMKYEDEKLTGGKVYDPEAKKLYYCTIKYDGKAQELNLRGSLDKKGILGRSQTWLKYKE